MTGINGLRDLHRQEGFIAPLPEGVMEFGGKMFEISKDGTEGRSSSPNPIDVKRTVDAIREAKMTCEAVLVMVHSHEIRKDNDEEADYFLEEFAHACIDAGASAVIGGGTHQLKGIELYRDCPIFYCLGNFIFENQYVRLLPADYMEKYGLNIHTAASPGGRSSPHIPSTKFRRSIGVCCRISRSVRGNAHIWSFCRSSLVWTGKTQKKIFRTWQTKKQQKKLQNISPA